MLSKHLAYGFCIGAKAMNGVLQLQVQVAFGWFLLFVFANLVFRAWDPRVC